MEKRLGRLEQAFWLAVFFTPVAAAVALVAWGLAAFGPALAMLAGIALFFARPLLCLGLVAVLMTAGAFG